MGFVETILAEKRKEVAEMKIRFPLPTHAMETCTGVRGRFRSSVDRGSIAVIAEIKKQSPSGGLFREHFDPAGIASLYQSNGADAVSVLTDFRFFGGSADVLKLVRQIIRLPILRKDFILDEYQVMESHRLKADAVLLIVRLLDSATLIRLILSANALAMDSLVEVRSESELERALDAGAEMVGVNNRDLDTFRVDLSVSLRLGKRIPSRIVSVSESGIRSRDDVIRLEEVGFRAVLVGETLMREPDVGAALRRLKGDAHATGIE